MLVRKIQQLIFNRLSLLLVWIRYRNKKDPFKTFSRIIKPADLTRKSDTTKGLILITPVRVAPISNLFEALIGKYYQLKGHEVKFLMCNQAVSFCENIDKNGNSAMACALCLKEQKRFKSYLKVDILKADAYIKKPRIREIRQIVAGRDFLSKDDFIHNDVNLREPILAAVMRYTLKSNLKGDQGLIRKFAETAFIYSELLSNILKEKKVAKIITSHGIYSTWGAILETAKANKVETVVWGRGYLGQGNLLFSRNENLEREFSSEGKEVISGIDLNDEQVAAVKSYFERKMKPESNVDYINYYKDISYSNSNELAGVDHSKFSKVFGMFTNIPWDGEMLKTTPSFPTTVDFVQCVLQWFESHSDCLLIIRAHPAEVSREEGIGTETFEELLFNLRPVLPANVIFIKPSSSISSYAVSEIADAVILFGSTMSLELAIQKKIVLQTGVNNVTNKNIVFDCSTTTEFYNYLELVRKGELAVTEDMYSNALKYAHYWLFKRHIHDTSVELSKLQFKKFNFDDEAGFLEDRMLGYVYKKIENKEKIVYE